MGEVDVVIVSKPGRWLCRDQTDGGKQLTRAISAQGDHGSTAKLESQKKLAR